MRKAFRFVAHLQIAILATAVAAHIGMAEVQFQEKENGVLLSNEHVALTFDFPGRQYSVADGATGEVILENAGFAANGWGMKGVSDWNGWTESHATETVDDGFGRGQRLVVAMEHAKRPAVPVYMFNYTL